MTDLLQFYDRQRDGRPPRETSKAYEKLSGRISLDRHRRFNQYSRVRKVTGKFTASAHATGDQELCIMPNQDVLHDSEAQPDTATVTTATRVDSEKAFCKARQMLFSNALPGVCNRNNGTIIVTAPG